MAPTCLNERPTSCNSLLGPARPGFRDLCFLLGDRESRGTQSMAAPAHPQLGPHRRDLAWTSGPTPALPAPSLHFCGGRLTSPPGLQGKKPQRHRKQLVPLGRNLVGQTWLSLGSPACLHSSPESCLLTGGRQLGVGRSKNRESSPAAPLAAAPQSSSYSGCFSHAR